MRSRMMLTANLVELMINGTSGLSNARVDVLTAYSTAEPNAENADMRMYLMLADLTSMGTKPSANVDAPDMNAILRMRPSTDWKSMSVWVSCNRCRKSREVLSPMINQEARGSPSLKVSLTTPMYVYASVVTTIEESMLATQSLDSVEYRAGKMKAHMLNRRAPV